MKLNLFETEVSTEVYLIENLDTGLLEIGRPKDNYKHTWSVEEAMTLMADIKFVRVTDVTIAMQVQLDDGRTASLSNAAYVNSPYGYIMPLIAIDKAKHFERVQPTLNNAIKVDSINDIKDIEAGSDITYSGYLCKLYKKLISEVDLPIV